MEQFKFSKDSFKEVRKTLVIRMITISLLVIAGYGAMNYFSANAQQSSVNSLPFFILSILLVMPLAMYIGVKRQKMIWDSYILTIDDNAITREQHNTPTITILNTDLREVVKNPNGSFTLQGSSSADMIVVPTQISDYEKLEKLLYEIKPITVRGKASFLQKIASLLPILILGLMAAVYISNDKIIVGVAGTILLTFLGYSFIQLQSSKNIDNRTKNGLWLMVFVTASILGFMCIKLMGLQ